MGDRERAGERVLHVQRDHPGLPAPSEIRLVLSDQPPPPELTTGAFALAFDGDRLLMTDERGRGLNIVGGGVEPGETPEEALRREAAEEAAVELVDLEVVAYQRVRLLGPKPEGYRFPYPDSYMVVFRARVAALGPFEPNESATRRALVAPEELPGTFWGGLAANRRLYEAARRGSGA
jgi:8-oxo-dGTP diphosphatase